MSSDPIAVERLQARAALAGIQFDPDQIQALAELMENTLAPLRRIDATELRSIEPVVAFDLTRE